MNCKFKFLSIEPIIGEDIGNKNGKYLYRESELEWYEKIISDCKANYIPVFVKQLGTHLKEKLSLKDRHGGNIDEFANKLKVREFPKEKRVCDNCGYLFSDLSESLGVCMSCGLDRNKRRGNEEY